MMYFNTENDGEYCVSDVEALRLIEVVRTAKSTETLERVLNCDVYDVVSSLAILLEAKIRQKPLVNDAQLYNHL